jgi:hypothetical protein
VPFQPIDITLEFGKPEHLVTAAAGDVYMFVSCTTFGAAGVAGGPNYVVGKKNEAGDHVTGLYVTTNEFETDLSEGDELWVAAAEELTFTSSIRITGLVRSVPPRSQAQGDAERDGG